jgi:bifunctional DNA-binding transcriptional regulator/antitoxin component of YhaV-PrlF toxin-antitoxin module
MNNKIGVLKDIDNLGRLVIPKEMRDTFKLDKSVELVVTEEGVLVRNPKYKLIKKEEVEGD